MSLYQLREKRTKATQERRHLMIALTCEKSTVCMQSARFTLMDFCSPFMAWVLIHYLFLHIYIYIKRNGT